MDVINSKSSIFHSLIIFLLSVSAGICQDLKSKSNNAYKKRILEDIEIEYLTNYYSQDGKYAAVTGGIGSEELIYYTPARLILRIPIGEDNTFTFDGTGAYYTSASSSNVDPFDGKKEPNPFHASSGASRHDGFGSIKGTLTHWSEDRKKVWTSNLSTAVESDYFSIGLGGSRSVNYNSNNTKVEISSNLFLDQLRTIYPYELRSFKNNRPGINDYLFRRNTIIGNRNYSPKFIQLKQWHRNTFFVGLGLIQILSKRSVASFEIDAVMQYGLLSTPHQRVYFSDFEDSYIEKFHLADDIERLPNSRTKLALGIRINHYLSDLFIIRTNYRYYRDDWSMVSNTAKLEIPIKISNSFTLLPDFRYYIQSASEYFAPYNQHISSSKFYTSDHDYSKFKAIQYGVGINYNDILSETVLNIVGMDAIGLRFYNYKRDSGFNAFGFSMNFKFSFD